MAIILVAGACSTWSAELAVVPGTAFPDTSPSRSAPATPSVREAPTATAAAPRVTPRPTSKPARVARAEPEAEPTPKPRKKREKVIRLSPRPAPGAFAMNLFRKGDFVHQATKNWCVAGSTQTMMTIMDSGKPYRSISYQRQLYDRGRQLSPNKSKLGPIGVDLTGWAELLNTNGYGPYVVEASETRRGAIRKAARAIRVTGKPVGLVTWRGAHSWVMSGFTATGDPAYANDFQVKAVNIQDVWFPYVSTIWGASDPPNTLVPMGQLKEDYLSYARPRARWPKRDGKFMLILPVLPRNTVAR
jgi:hypothetical protein